MKNVSDSQENCFRHIHEISEKRTMRERLVKFSSRGIFCRISQKFLTENIEFYCTYHFYHFNDCALNLLIQITK